MKTALLLLSFAMIASAQPPDTLWSYWSGAPFGGNLFASVQQTADGGYVLAGRYGGNFPYVVRLSSAGDSLWTKVIEESAHSGIVNSVRQTHDGGFILACQRITSGWLLKLNGQGDSLWGRTFAGTSQLYCVRETSDDGFVVSGEGNSDAFLAKTDSSGVTEWSRAYGGALYQAAVQVEITNDGGFVLVGVTQEATGDLYDVMLIRTNENGDTLWTRVMGSAGLQGASAVQETADGGFIIAGRTAASWEAPSDAYMIKTDADGNVQWSRSIGGLGGQTAMEVEQTDDGGYVFAGTTGNLSNGPTDYYVVKTDANGDTVWTTTYDRSNLEYALSAQITQDGGYVIAGWSETTGNGMAYVVKTAPLAPPLPPQPDISVIPSVLTFSSVFVGDSAVLPVTITSTGDTDLVVSSVATPQDLHTDFEASRTLAPGESLVVNVTFAPTEAREYVDTLLVHSNAPDSIVAVQVTGTGATNASRERNHMPQTYALSVYPNPFNSTVMIHYDLPTAGHLSMRLYDLLGREVAELIDQVQKAGSHQLTLNAASLASGAYFVRMASGDFNRTQRIMLMR